MSQIIEAGIRWERDRAEHAFELHRAGYGNASGQVYRGRFRGAPWWWEVRAEFPALGAAPEAVMSFEAAEGLETREAAEEQAGAVMRRVNGWLDGEEAGR